jgi:Ca2+-binding RTX toxin-like protein
VSRKLLAVAVAAAALALVAVQWAVGSAEHERLTGTARGETIRGGFAADRLVGLGGPDLIIGGFGGDAAKGGAGADRIFGGYGGDRLEGGPGNDRLNGQDDDDRLFGGPGRDNLSGGDEDDRLSGGPAPDRLNGGGEDDRIQARDGARDLVLCGEGTDTVSADVGDRVAEDCENVTPPEAKPVGTARERPFPFGVPASTLDGWALQVVATAPDATAAVLAENPFNDPPPVGGVFSIARLRATRTGAGAESFDAGFRARAVGSAAVVYTTFENSCGVIPEPFPETDVFTGGQVEGNVCWAVPAVEAGSLVLIDHAFLAEQDRFFAMR